MNKLKVKINWHFRIKPCSKSFFILFYKKENGTSLAEIYQIIPKPPYQSKDLQNRLTDKAEPLTVEAQKGTIFYDIAHAALSLEAGGLGNPPYFSFYRRLSRRIFVRKSFELNGGTPYNIGA